MVARAPGKKSPRGTTPPGKPNANKPLNTSKGQFSFTMVADGCYIEHKWGQNSGHVGVPLEAMPAFIARMQTMYESATGQAASKKSPGTPKGAITKGGKAAKEEKAKEAKPKKEKEKKEPQKKKTVEELDAELTAYTAERGAEGAMEEGAEATADAA